MNGEDVNITATAKTNYVSRERKDNNGSPMSSLRVLFDEVMLRNIRK